MELLQLLLRSVNQLEFSVDFNENFTFISGSYAGFYLVDENDFKDLIYADLDVENLIPESETLPFISFLKSHNFEIYTFGNKLNFKFYTYGSKNN